MIAWVCGECQAKNPASAEGRFCRACGSPRNPSLGNGKALEPEFLPPWRRPGWVEPRPDDRCQEAGCTKTAREHIEEFRALVSKPGTVFTRPSAREVEQHALPDEAVLEARRQMLLRQAEQLRAGDDAVPF